MPTPQIDPQTGERIQASGAPQIDPATGERVPAAPTAQPAPQGGVMGGLKSFADATGLRPLAHSIMHPVQAQQEESQTWSDHPMQKLGESAVPGLGMIEGAYQGAKRIGGELVDAGKSAMEGNGAGAAYHGIKAVPFVGPALDRASDESAPTDSYRDSYGKQLGATLGSSRAMGTLAGTAATVAPMILGGIDSAAPNRSQFAPIAAPLRDAAIGDTDAAALRGLRVPANGKKVLPMQRSVQTARPYLQGASSLEDLQSRIPAAKAEAFAPYSQTIDAVGDNPVKGPDGMTTIRALEDERQELSAMNRGLKTGDPSALRLAEQKGMSQADSLARERAIQAHLDPELSRYGIDPQGLRKTYGAISRVGNQIEGRSTLLEEPQAYGFSKAANPFELFKGVELTKPSTYVKPLSNLADAGRDIAAGRYRTASPTDVGVREGFANAEPKPDLGQYTPFKPTGLLGKPPIELGGSPEVSGSPEGYRPPNFYHDTDAMRLGRLLPAPPIELGGATEGTRPPPFHHDTTPMRMGRILPEGVSDDMPPSSYSDIFPEQLPQATRIKPKIIEGKK